MKHYNVYRQFQPTVTKNRGVVTYHADVRRVGDILAADGAQAIELAKVEYTLVAPIVHELDALGHEVWAHP